MAYIGKIPAAAALTADDITDGIITNAKLAQDIISGDTALGAEPADTDEFLVSDAGTLKRMDYSHIKGGGAWTFISKATISDDSEIDIESGIDSTYPLYCFSLNNIKVATDNSYLLGRVKVSSFQTGSDYQYAATDTRTNGTVFDNDTQESTGATAIRMQSANAQGNAATESFNHLVYLPNPSNTSYYKVLWGEGVGFRDDGNMCRHMFFGGYTGGAGAVTGVRFYLTSGNLTSGTITLYGIKDS
jgi:hypothetical protein